MTEVKRFAVGDLLRELLGDPAVAPENVGPTRVVRISEDRQTIWLESAGLTRTIECKIVGLFRHYRYIAEFATFGNPFEDDVYLEYSAEAIETVFTEYGVARTDFAESDEEEEDD